jgi:hypothetical protein
MFAFNKTVATRDQVATEKRHYASTTIKLRLATARRLAYDAELSELPFA